jgi:magnesium chelatase family protein
MHGPPGVGKTLLAERLPGILPDLDASESLEVSAIHSLAGLPLHDGLIRRPPYADPHHSASLASVVGGGARMALPGSISRAHRGVLFLDEASNGKCTSLSKEVTDDDEDEAAWRERAAGSGDAGGGLPGVQSDGAEHAGRGHAADLSVSAAVEVSQGQGGCDRASAS